MIDNLSLSVTASKLHLLFWCKSGRIQGFMTIATS